MSKTDEKDMKNEFKNFKLQIKKNPPGTPFIRGVNSLAYKYFSPTVYKKYNNLETNITSYTFDRLIKNAILFPNCHVGVYAGDEETYSLFGKDYLDLIIKDYHGIKGAIKHKKDLNVNKIKEEISDQSMLTSCRIRVARNITGFGLSAGITKQQRLEVESLMKKVFRSLKGDFAGKYYPMKGMSATTKNKLIDNGYLFIDDDPALETVGMYNDWPNGRGIFFNHDKTFLVWVNEEDQLRIISMEHNSGNVKRVAKRLMVGLNAIEAAIKKISGRSFMYNNKIGYLTTCPSNLGTGMRASCLIKLPNHKKKGGMSYLKPKCKKLNLQPRGTKGESKGGDTGVYDISNVHRLGYTEVELIRTMINGVNQLIKDENKLS